MDKGTCTNIPLYLLGDKSYLLISWIMTPFKKKGQHIIFELIYNQKHKCGCFVINNIFKILKKLLKGIIWEVQTPCLLFLMCSYVFAFYTKCWGLKMNITFND